MVDYMRSHAIEGPWPAGDRVLVCIQGGNKASPTVRHAKRLADQLRAPWTAIYVETTRSARADAADQGSVVEALRLAQRLGAEPVLIPGQDVADSVIDYARANNVTHLIVGKSDRPRWRQLLSGSITQRLINRAGGINIHVIEVPAERTDGTPIPPVAEPKPAFDPRPYVIAALLVGIGDSGRHRACTTFLGITNVALVFLTAILIGAVLHGLGPSLFACFLAMLAYNFFFLPPLYTFTIADPENVVALFFFAVVAVIASNLAARVRGQALSARLRARQTDDLYQFSRKLAVAVTLDDLLWATAHQIALMLKVRVVLLLPGEWQHRPARRLPAGGHAGRGGPRRGQMVVGERTISPAADRTRCLAPNGCSSRLRTGRGPLGVVGIIRDEPGPLLTPDQQRLLDAWRIRPRWRSSGSTSPATCIWRACRWRPTGCAPPC